MQRVLNRDDSEQKVEHGAQTGLNPPMLKSFVGPIALLIAFVSACESEDESALSVDAAVPQSGNSDAGTRDAASPDAARLMDATPGVEVDTMPAVDAAPTVGRALRFDGVNDLVNLYTNNALADQDSFTSEVWFRSSAATGMFLEVFGAGADRSLYLRNKKVCFYVYIGGFSEICTTAETYNDGAWHHAAGTLGADGQILYVDGEPAATAVNVKASVFANDSGLRAGYGYIGPNGVLTFLNGDLDDIRLWNVQRTAAEIKNNRNAPVDPTTTGLQANWRLDEVGTATKASDSTSGNLQGSLQGFTFDPSPWIANGAY